MNERKGLSGVLTSPDRCTDPSHRSYSTDRNWDVCQFKSHALDSGMVERGGYSAKTAVGKVVDDAVKAAVLGEPFDISALTDRYWREYDITDPKAKGLEKSERLFELWDAEVRPDWERRGIYAVEWELHFEIEGIPCHIHPDVVFLDGSVDDLKTSEARLDRSGNGRAEYDQQLSWYAMGVEAVFGTIPPEVILDGLIYANPPDDVRAYRPEATKPWWDRQKAVRTPAQLESFAEEVRRRDASRRFARTTGIYQTQGRTSAYECNGCPARRVCPSFRAFPDKELQVIAA